VSYGGNESFPCGVSALKSGALTTQGFSMSKVLEVSAAELKLEIDALYAQEQAALKARNVLLACRYRAQRSSKMTMWLCMVTA
jgi:hypothetical protein